MAALVIAEALRLSPGNGAVTPSLYASNVPGLPVGPLSPDPPSGVEVAASVIAKFGRAAVDVFAGLVTNTWVLAIFALGIGLAFAVGIIARARRSTSRPVG